MRGGLGAELSGRGQSRRLRQGAAATTRRRRSRAARRAGCPRRARSRCRRPLRREEEQRHRTDPAAAPRVRSAPSASQALPASVARNARSPRSPRSLEELEVDVLEVRRRRGRRERLRRLSGNLRRAAAMYGLEAGGLGEPCQPVPASGCASTTRAARCRRRSSAARRSGRSPSSTTASARSRPSGRTGSCRSSAARRRHRRRRGRPRASATTRRPRAVRGAAPTSPADRRAGERDADDPAELAERTRPSAPATPATTATARLPPRRVPTGERRAEPEREHGRPRAPRSRARRRTRARAARPIAWNSVDPPANWSERHEGGRPRSTRSARAEARRADRGRGAAAERRARAPAYSAYFAARDGVARRLVAAPERVRAVQCPGEDQTPQEAPPARARATSGAAVPNGMTRAARSRTPTAMTTSTAASRRSSSRRRRRRLDSRGAGRGTAERRAATISPAQRKRRVETAGGSAGTRREHEHGEYTGLRMRSTLLWRRGATAAGIYGAAAFGFLGTIVASRQLSVADYGASRS